MDLRDIIIGGFWLVLGNLVFYFVYPLFGSLVDGFGTSAVGSFGLTNTIVAIGWGGYFLLWGIAGVVVPIYLIIKGASRD